MENERTIHSECKRLVRFGSDSSPEIHPAVFEGASHENMEQESEMISHNTRSTAWSQINKRIDLKVEHGWMDGDIDN